MIALHHRLVHGEIGDTAKEDDDQVHKAIINDLLAFVSCDDAENLPALLRSRKGETI